MFIERVKFGNGVAIELRGTSIERCTLYALVVYALGDEMSWRLPDLPESPETPLRSTETNEFEDACFTIIDEYIEPKHRWLMLCTDVDFFTGAHAATFNKVVSDTFGIEENGTEGPSEGFAHCQRCWFVDRETRRIFLTHFHFAKPIYQTSLFAGKLLRSASHTGQATHLKDSLVETPVSSTPTLTPTSPLLTRLRQLLSDETRMRIESPKIETTEFIIGHVTSWCGDRLSKRTSSVWIAQQLNVWFKSTQYYHTKHADADAAGDCCVTFRVQLSEHAHSFTSIHDDYQTLMPLDAPSAENTMVRYPRGGPEFCCSLPAPIGVHPKTIGIGHFLPVQDVNATPWITTHTLIDVRLFRVYRTQYPFIYTLMPDDDRRVQQLKAVLKRSEECNPGVVAPSRASSRAASRAPSRKNQSLSAKSTKSSSEKYTPLVATLPTLECERFVRSVFRKKPKLQYHLFYCVRYDDADAKTIWIPVYPG